MTHPSPAEKPSEITRYSPAEWSHNWDVVPCVSGSYVRYSDHAESLSRLAGELARVEGERDAARRAQIVRFKVEPWEDGEMVITANGAPMGGTISRSEANAACRWVASAWADLIKANNTPTPPAKEQR